MGDRKRQEDKEIRRNYISEQKERKTKTETVLKERDKEKTKTVCVKETGKRKN